MRIPHRVPVSIGYNISIDILVLYADIDAVANGNLLVGDYD